MEQWFWQQAGEVSGGLFVGRMWLLVLYIRFTISYCRDVIDLHKYLEEATFESHFSGSCFSFLKMVY